MPTSGPRFPTRFDADIWTKDLAHSTPAGREAARSARRRYEGNGVPRSHLRPCEREERSGIDLPDCAKVYVPHPNGRWGMVFQFVIPTSDSPHLRYLAFGVRHHPRGSNAFTVYEAASRRLHAKDRPARSCVKRRRRHPRD